MSHFPAPPERPHLVTLHTEAQITHTGAHVKIELLDECIVFFWDPMEGFCDVPTATPIFKSLLEQLAVPCMELHLSRLEKDS